jgi:hypothetical protein
VSEGEAGADSGGEGPLPDGDYEAFVIDVDDRDDGSRSVDLTIVSGPHKGAVLSMVATGLDGEFTDLIGMPATLTVRDGTPNVVIDH